MRRLLILSAAAASSVVLGAGAAQAYTINEFTAGLSASADPTAIAAGPDGNLWFVEAGLNQIGRITPGGTISEFSQGIPNGDGPDALDGAIAAGPDGDVWFTAQNGNIGKVTPTGAIAEFNIPGAGDLRGIVTGPDGDLWLADNATRIFRTTTTSPGSATGFSTNPPGLSDPDGIAKGPDGNLWFTSDTTGLWKMSTSGTATQVIAAPNAGGNGAAGLVAGPDGNIWETEQQTATAAIAVVSTSGQLLHEYDLPNGSSDPTAIAVGSDGALWFVENGNNAIGRITTSGQEIDIALPHTASMPVGIASGPDGNIWFTEEGGDRIGEIVLPHTLSIAISGSGTVTGSGISCSTGCSTTETGPVVLTATPAGGFSFSGWSGACSGTGSCTVPLASAASVTATFTQLPVISSPGPVAGAQPVVSSQTPAGSLKGNPSVSGTKVTFAYTCAANSATTCTAKATLTAVEDLNPHGQTTAVAASRRVQRTKTVTVGKVSVAVAPGKTVKFSISLNAAAESLLKRFHKLPADLTIVPNVGSKTVERVTFTLPKQRR